MGVRNAVQLDGSHCRAICDEIGERLRVLLAREASPIPPRLQRLLDRLAEQDLLPAPSIAPSMDDLVRQPELLADPGRLTDAA